MDVYHTVSNIHNPSHVTSVVDQLLQIHRHETPYAGWCLMNIQHHKNFLPDTINWQKEGWEIGLDNVYILLNTRCYSD